MSNVKKTFIGGAECRELNRRRQRQKIWLLDWVVCSNEQFCFQMRLECGDDSGTFSSWRQRVPDSLCSNWKPWIESWSLPPADRVVVDGRISEYELVDDNEASHVDKPLVVTFDYCSHCSKQIIVCKFVVGNKTISEQSASKIVKKISQQIARLCRQLRCFYGTQCREFSPHG